MQWSRGLLPLSLLLLPYLITILTRLTIKTLKAVFSKRSTETTAGSIMGTRTDCWLICQRAILAYSPFFPPSEQTNKRTYLVYNKGYHRENGEQEELRQGCQLFLVVDGAAMCCSFELEVTISSNCSMYGLLGLVGSF